MECLESNWNYKFATPFGEGRIKIRCETTRASVDLALFRLHLDGTSRILGAVNLNSLLPT